MKKRRVVALLNSIEAAGAQVLHDTTAQEWSINYLSTNKENLLGPFRYGKGVRVEYFDPQAEVRQIILIGASTTKETIVASTRYRIEISSTDNRYESDRKQPGIFAYTSASTLSGLAATDRATIYQALVDKINRYAGANCTAYALSVAEYTDGTSTANAHTNFVIGEVVDQETTAETARVAKCQIDTGTFADDDAAGFIWLFDLSTTNAAWDNTGLDLVARDGAGKTNCTVTVTNATTVHQVGIAIEDAAGYFTSNLDRGGVNFVGVTQGFSTDTTTVGLAGVYAMGIADDMISQKPVFDITGQDLIRGNLEYDFQGNAPVSGYTYTKCVITTADGDEDALGGTRETSERETIMYLYYSDGDLADFKTHLDLAIAY